MPDLSQFRLIPADIRGMSFPVRCRFCGCVHDAGSVTVVQRYTDCTTWRCPGCSTLIDDRPPGWGGSAIPLNRATGEPLL